MQTLKWKVLNNLDIYEGDRLVCCCVETIDASRIVAAIELAQEMKRLVYSAMGKSGGPARANSLTAAQRSKIAGVAGTAAKQKRTSAV